MKCTNEVLIAVAFVITATVLGSLVIDDCNAAEQDNQEYPSWVVGKLYPNEAPGSIEVAYKGELITLYYASTTGCEIDPFLKEHTIITISEEQLKYTGIRFLDEQDGENAKVTNILVNMNGSISLNVDDLKPIGENIAKRYYYLNVIPVKLQFSYLESVYTLNVNISLIALKTTPVITFDNLNLVYNANVQGPIVKLNDKIIWKNAKYTSWANNNLVNNGALSIRDGSGINANDYTIIITIDGDKTSIYNGITATENWKISKANLKDVASAKYYETVYNGQLQDPSQKVNPITTTLGETLSCKVVVEPQVKPGDYKYVLKAPSNSNYTGSITGKWAITQKEITRDMISVIPDELACTGDELCPESVIITDKDIVNPHESVAAYYVNGNELASNLYEYSFEARVEAGFGKTTVTILPNELYKEGTFTFTDGWQIIDPIDIGQPWNVDGKELKLTVRVNVLKLTDGFMDSSTFTDDNTFLYPKAKIEALNLPDRQLDRDHYTVVVEDANGKIIVDQKKGISGSTQSEWNYIYVTGTNGFTGTIEGEFYVDIGSREANYEIGSTFSEDGLVYTVTSLDNKTVSVTGYEAGIQAGVAIPDYVEGFKVTKIGTKAFYGCKTITSVDLGENITSVGIKAFANCTKLETVVFDDALKTISAYAFYNCGKLTSIDLPDKVRTIGSYAFYKCNALTSVSFDDALKTVGTKTFTVSFENASGKVIKQTAKNLAGKTFEGSDKVLKLVA